MGIVGLFSSISFQQFSKILPLLALCLLLQNCTLGDEIVKNSQHAGDFRGAASISSLYDDNAADFQQTESLTPPTEASVASVTNPRSCDAAAGCPTELFGSGLTDNQGPPNMIRHLDILHLDGLDTSSGNEGGGNTIGIVHFAPVPQNPIRDNSYNKPVCFTNLLGQVWCQEPPKGGY